ncbi:hypothetical protein [Photobacterium damselae]|nr:hypothetical protein [Photobacterium damselae]
MRVTTVFIVVQGLSTSQLENLLKTLEERLTGLAFRNTKWGINVLVSSLLSKKLPLNPTLMLTKHTHKRAINTHQFAHALSM